MNTLEIPEPTVKRLSSYLLVLLQLQEQGKRYVSSNELADELFIESGKVRKDFQYARIKGRPKRGYEVPYLIQEIDRILNWTGPKPAIIIGAGSLGTAMLGYENFNRYGIKFMGAFDVDRRRVGMDIHGVKISHIDDLESVVKSKGIKIAVMTLPGENIQEITDRLVKAGIKGIWNFAPVRLGAPEGVAVVNAQFSESLAVLTQQVD